jgi:glycosyltransferase involved in cell wall biosynthesis
MMVKRCTGHPKPGRIVKLLIISYFFPPQKGIGGKRIFRFVSRLPALGIQPIVLTTPWPPRDDRDLEQPLTAEGVVVDREYVPNWLWRLYHGESGSEYQPGPLARLFSRLNRLFGPPIDGKSYLAPFAFRRAMQLAKEHKIEAVLSTSAPYSSHLVAMQVSKRLNLPFYADLRDPWSFNFLFDKRSPRLRERDRRAERSVFAAAHNVFLAARATRDKYVELYPEYAEKFLTIYSGFLTDPPEAPVANWPTSPRPRIGIVHFGRFYGVRRMDRILSSLDSAVKANALQPTDLQLLILGDVAKADLNHIRELGLEPFIAISPMLPYEKGLAVLRDADALFLCDYDVQPFFVPGKLFDYFRVHKPIFTLSANEELRNLIHETKAGRAVHPDDVAGQSEIWNDIINKGPQKALAFELDEQAMRRLSVDAAAELLAEVLLKKP